MKAKLKIDHVLMSFLIIFFIISILTIYSASTYLPSSLGNLVLKQILWYTCGFIVSFLIIKIGYSKILDYAWFFYFLGLLLLILLFPFGTTINQSTCWFKIPGIGSVQPSEFMKVALLLVLIKVTVEFRKKKDNSSFRSESIYLGKVFLIVLFPSILTFLQPDTGAVFMNFVITLFIVFMSGIRFRWFLSFGIIAIVGLSILLYLYYQERDFFIELFGTNLFYRIDRLLDWKKGDGYQLENALISIGSSGLFGHGWNKTPLYFPESGTDFIFAVFASNFGLIGSIIFLILLGGFDYYIFTIIKHEKKDSYFFLLIGVLGIILYQQVQNIGMTLGMMPITGITLPFISYGGSSLVSYFILIGCVFSIQNEKKRI